MDQPHICDTAEAQRWKASMANAIWIPADKYWMRDFELCGAEYANERGVRRELARRARKRRKLAP